MNQETNAIVRQSRKEIVLEARGELLRKARRVKMERHKQYRTKICTKIMRRIAHKLGLGSVYDLKPEEKEALFLLSRSYCVRSLCWNIFLTGGAPAILWGLGYSTATIIFLSARFSLYFILNVVSSAFSSEALNFGLPNWWEKIAFLCFGRKYETKGGSE
ncbi:MAG: hypothetical protein Q7R73_03285 [bacterium]|nr:hypothetical protein [bacterium]